MSFLLALTNNGYIPWIAVMINKALFDISGSNRSATFTLGVIENRVKCFLPR